MVGIITTYFDCIQPLKSDWYENLVKNDVKYMPYRIHKILIYLNDGK